MKQLILFSTAFCFLLTYSAAQPLQKFIGSSGKDIIAQIIPTPDGNFLATGTRQVNDTARVWLLKINQTGSVLWEKTFLPEIAGTEGYGNGLAIMPDSAIVIACEQRFQGNFVGGAGMGIKTDAAGNLLWKQSYPNANTLFDVASNGSAFLFVGVEQSFGQQYQNGLVMQVNSAGTLQWQNAVYASDRTEARRIFPMPDGNFMLAGRANDSYVSFAGIFIQKITPNGATIWERKIDMGWSEILFSGNADSYYNLPLAAAEQPDGSIWIANHHQANLALVHCDAAGNLLSPKTYDGLYTGAYPYCLAPMPDGGWLITGETDSYTSPLHNQGFALRLLPSGLELWRQYYGLPDANSKLFGGYPLADGQLLLAGATDNPAGHGGFDGWVLRTTSEGSILPWRIECRMVYDLNNNCQADPGEPPATGWFISAKDSAGTRLVATDLTGQCILRTRASVTDMTALAPDPAGAWKFCTQTQTAVTDMYNPVSKLTFLVQPVAGGCPRTEVSLTQPDLVRCQTSSFYVTVQNRGTGGSTAQTLSLTLDSALHIVDASDPYFVNGHSIDFDIPPMDGLQQKVIRVGVNLTCNVQIGATHPVVARLSPVACLPAWTGPRFAADGYCAGANVQFSLINEGGGGNAAVTRYRVVADEVIVSDWTNISLPEGGPAHPLVFPADGRTWRVEVEQVPGFLFDRHSTATVEGCGIGANGLYSVKFANPRPFDERAPNVAAILPPNTTGASNKIAEMTVGVGNYNLISDYNGLEYCARIRNPLGVVAQQAEFRLSFSANLDVSTFQPVAYNAPVRVEVDNNGIIHATLSGLQLDTAGYIMLRFRIKPFAGVPPDSLDASGFFVNGEVYIDNVGPFQMTRGYNYYSKSFPSATDPAAGYDPAVLEYRGGGYEFAHAMATGTDGSVWLVGETSSFSDRETTDGLLIKANADGRAIWQTAIDLGDQGYNTFTGVASLPDGGCMVVGDHVPHYAVNLNLEYNSAYVARIDHQGKMLWHKKIRPANPGYGSSANGIITAGDGNFVVYGRTIDSSGTDQFYTKINPQGDVLWQRTADVDTSEFEPKKAIRLADGSLVFYGRNHNSWNPTDVFLEKIDTAGHRIWARGYNSPNYLQIVPGGIAPMSDGGFMLNGHVGLSYSPVLVEAAVFLRVSPQGYVLWQKNTPIGPNKRVFISDIVPAPDSGFYSVGGISVDPQNFERVYVLLKTNDNGDTLWWRSYRAQGDQNSETALISPTGKLLQWGTYGTQDTWGEAHTILIRTDLQGGGYVGTRPEPVRPEVQVYPNPAASMVYVRFSPGGRWELRDMLGRVVRSGVGSDAAFGIAVDRLAVGGYLLCFPEVGVVKRVVVGW
jgi:hypothetical protein